MSPTPEMRRWRLITLAWCFLMCIAIALIVAGGTYYFVTRTTDRLDRQGKALKRNNANLARNNAKLIKVNDGLQSTNYKLSRTLSLAVDNQNRAACSIRGALITARDRTRVGLAAAMTPADKAKAQKAIDDYSALIDAQRTTPLAFKCESILNPGGSP